MEAKDDKTETKEVSSDMEGRRQTAISDVIADKMIKQLGNELSNHNLYKSFQAYFASNGFTKLDEYYKKRAEEEYNHHEWFAERLRDNDIDFQYPAISKIDVDIEDFISPFKITVDKEIETTESINDIAKTCFEEGDYTTLNWISSVLLQEQNEEESTSRSALDIAEREDTSWEIKAEAILRLLN